MHQLGTETQVPCCTALMFASYSWLYPDKSITAAQAFTAIALLNMVQAMAAGGMGETTVWNAKPFKAMRRNICALKIGWQTSSFSQETIWFWGAKFGSTYLYWQGLPIFPNLWAVDFHVLSCDREWQQWLDTNDDTFLTIKAHTHTQ